MVNPNVDDFKHSNPYLSYFTSLVKTLEHDTFFHCKNVPGEREPSELAYIKRHGVKGILDQKTNMDLKLLD